MPSTSTSYYFTEEDRVIHNDLMLHNILRFGETFEPIDFEDALVEKKWIFADLTDLMFQGYLVKRENSPIL